MAASAKAFSEYLLERFPPDSKRGTSGVFLKKFGEKIEVALKNPSSVDKNVRFYVKKHEFQLLNLPSISSGDILVVPSKEASSQSVPDTSILGNFRKVVYVEDFYDVIREIHEKELLHAGYKKTHEKIQSMYYGIPRSVVEKYTSLCSGCQLKKPQFVKAPLQPIIANGFMSRLQIDLIDMRHLPDGNYKWILHCVDHWSKFNFAYPLESKHAVGVCDALDNKLFPYFGVPRILHSDNGREFNTHKVCKSKD